MAETVALNSNTRITIDPNTADGIIKVGDNEYPFTANGSYYLYLGAKNGYGAYSAHALFYSVQIYRDGESYRYYVPAVNSSGKVGLYDLVEGKFTSATGNVIAGPAV